MKHILKKSGHGIVRILCAVVPVYGDSKREWIRKIALLIALLVFIGSAVYLLDDLVLQPTHTRVVMETLRDLYHEEPSVNSSEPGEDTTIYPEGMNDVFRSLYRRNTDVRGWLTFTTEGEDLFGGAIDNPIVQTTDNEYYLDHDFLGDIDKAGSLYFDYRNDLSVGGANRNLIVYGHNLNSGLMFSRFNLLAKSNLDRARQVTTLTLNTLYEQRTYKVFAVMIINANAQEETVFNYIRTEFTDDEFVQFVDELRSRSLYDFGDVDVRGDDELLTLSTCSNKRETHLNDGRTVIVARKLREGEDPTVDVSKTVLNEDVLMPKMWYIAKGKELPEVYQ
ncbi:MAG: class B sortase [Clostridia bacterium]|nr:class B sortase [Clostridia bacterium]